MRHARLLLRFLAAAGFLLFVSSVAAQAEPKVLAVHFSLDINPVSQDYVNHQIDRANDDGYSAVVILLDTPGGLSTSMEKIYEKILASRVPVIVYVSPLSPRTCSRWRRRRTSDPRRRSTRAAETSAATCAAR
jgi:membrane-bound serine protease (ClpP class)